MWPIGHAPLPLLTQLATWDTGNNQLQIASAMTVAFSCQHLLLLATGYVQDSSNLSGSSNSLMGLFLFLQLLGNISLACLDLGSMPPLLMLRLDGISLLLENLHRQGYSCYAVDIPCQSLISSLVASTIRTSMFYRYALQSHHQQDC